MSALGREAGQFGRVLLGLNSRRYSPKHLDATPPKKILSRKFLNVGAFGLDAPESPSRFSVAATIPIAWHANPNSVGPIILKPKP